MSSMNGLSDIRKISVTGMRYLICNVLWSITIIARVLKTNNFCTHYGKNSLKRWISLSIQLPCHYCEWFCWQCPQRQHIDRPSRPKCASIFDFVSISRNHPEMDVQHFVDRTICDHEISSWPSPFHEVYCELFDPISSCTFGTASNRVVRNCVKIFLPC